MLDLLIACAGTNVSLLSGLRTGIAVTCPDIQLAAGSHNFTVTADLSDGSRKVNSVDWSIIPTLP